MSGKKRKIIVGVLMIVIGLVIGALGALGLTHLLASLLFGL